MNPTREEALFALALEKPASERGAFLNRECSSDAALRARLEALLAVHKKAAGSLPDDSDGTTAIGPIQTHLPASTADETQGTLIGRYKLLEKLGEGGFGAVWLAEQKEPVRRKVALKIIKLGMDTKQVVARFEAERQALALMDHPNIAKVLDAGTTDNGRPYFVMELVRGISITKFSDENNMPTKDRLDLFIKVCHAIQHAHQKGIIHRDIKPSNVMVTLHDGVPVPKVIDFGIAKATQGELTDKTIHTQFQQFIGTPAYMSPEQAEMSGLDIDTRSDIYSLGVLLYELLVGKTPFDAKELWESGIDAMRKTIREKEPVRPSTRLATLQGEELTTTAKRRASDAPKLIHLLKGDLDWIAMKCLEKDRTRRYETANGLAADITRYVTNEPVLARPPSAGYRLQKAFRRNRLAFAAGAAVAASLLAGLSVSTWLFIKESRAYREARTAESKQIELREVAENALDGQKQQRQRAESYAAQLEENLYFNRVALAHRELTAHPPNINQAEELLESCPAPMRDWEWRYLKRQWLDQPLVINHPGLKTVNSASMSRDDRYIASAGGDGSVRICDAETGQMLETISAHVGFAFCVAFDPTDSARLVSAGSDKQTRLWNWKTNATRPLHSWSSPLSFEWGLGYVAAFSPDGKRLAFPAENGEVKICSTATGELLAALPVQEGGLAFSVAFNPDGRLLATGGRTGVARVWDTRSGRLLHNLGRQKPPIACLTFSHDGGRLATASFDGSVEIWDVATGRRLLDSLAHGIRVIGVAFSADDRRLATASHDRTIALWDTATGRSVLTFRDFEKEAQCVAFSHDGHRLVAGGMDGTIRVWNATPLAESEGQGLLTLKHTGKITALALSRDGHWLASGGSRGPMDESTPVFVWDTSTGRRVHTLAGHASYVFSAAFSPDGRYIASTGDDSSKAVVMTVKVWDLISGQLAFTTEPVEAEGVLFCVSYSPDGRRLIATGRNGGKIWAWDTTTGRKISGPGDNQRTTFNMVLSPNARYLACAGKEGRMQLWDGRRLDEPQTAPREIGMASGKLSDTLAFSPDNAWLIAGNSDDTAAIWDVESGAEVRTLRDTGHGFSALAFSPDGRWIASGGMDCAVHVWDALTGNRLHTFRGHRGDITRLAFVPPDGMRLVSGSQDGTVKFWDMELLKNNARGIRTGR